MSARPRRTLAAAAGSLLLAAVLCEVVVRAVVHRDESGQETVLGTHLPPLRLPLDDITATLAGLDGGETFLVYDPDLGWAPRPHARSRAGPFRVDGAGIRTEGGVAPEPERGVLRVAIFGDSFTFGDEVPLEETWGFQLESALAARGVAAEVLNFGVNAYGMDQAYLRWLRDGRRYHPDVVIYGFQPENVLRNLNVFRPLYFTGTEVPLTKPRFVIRDGKLVAVNAPALPPGDVVAALAALPDHPLRAHERFFGPYQERWWMRSRLLALLASLGAADGQAAFRVSEEAGALAQAIAAAFARDVEETGAAFLVVHLPRRQDLVDRARGEIWYGAVLAGLEEAFVVVDPMAPGEPGDADFAPQGHYAAKLNRLVARALVAPVLEAARARVPGSGPVGGRDRRPRRR